MSTDAHPVTRLAPSRPGPDSIITADLLSPTPAGVRASDAEREDTIARLHHALGEGRLDLAETDARVAAVYAARYRSELAPLLTDLPGSPVVPVRAGTDAPAWSAIWVSAVWRARIALFAAGTQEQPPTARQCRIAAGVAVLAVVWMTACALLGAAVVGP